MPGPTPPPGEEPLHDAPTEAHDAYGGLAAPPPDPGRPARALSPRTWIAIGVAVVVVAVGAFFGVKAFAGGGSSSTSTASQTPNGGNGQGPGRQGTIGTLQSIDGSTLTVATIARGQNNGGAAAGGNTTTVVTNGTTKFYKTVSGSMSDIKVGDRVTANGTADGTNSLTAARITDTGTMTNAGFGGGSGAGRRFRNGAGPNGSTPPSNPNGGSPNPGNFANGTVKSISGTALTVTDNSGATKTVNTNGSTAVSVLKAVSISDLQTGQLVVVRGKTNSDGTVTATNVLQGVGGPGGGFGGFGRGGRFGGGNGNGSQGSTPDNGSTSQ